MPYCLKCVIPNCIGDGIFAVTMSTNSSARPTDCGELKYLPGPMTGTVSVSAWAGGAGDLWLGSKCKGQAQASQTNHLRYDGISNKWYLIPSNIHKAQIVGDVPGASLECVFFSGVTYDSQIANGVSITTEMGIDMGAKFSFPGIAGGPGKIPDLDCYSIEVAGVSVAYVNSISISVDYPNSPATAVYTFDFQVTTTEESC